MAAKSARVSFHPRHGGGFSLLEFSTMSTQSAVSASNLVSVFPNGNIRKMLNANKGSRGVLLILTDARGVFIPRDFVTLFDLTTWQGINPDWLPDLSAPSNEGYWVSWELVLNHATFQDKGQTWLLMQDGDLFAYCPELMTEEEKRAFGIDPE